MMAGIDLCQLPDPDIKGHSTLQGAFIEDDMMDRVEVWNGANGDAEPANALAVRFDGWGNLTKMQEFNIDWTLLNEADLTLQRIFSYDALNRRNGETIGSAGSTLYTDLTGNVIEERQWGISTTQNVFSPVTGELILRDRDTDNNASSGASTTPAGIDQRIYALYDGQGNISAITNSAGSVIERYFYTPEGQLTITDPAANTVRASSNYDWRYLYQGGRLDGTGIYQIGSSEWDYLSGGPLEHDAQAYWNDHLAITPESLSFYDRAVLTAAAPLAGTAGLLVGGPAGGFLAYAGVRGFQGGYHRYAAGQGWTGAVQGGLSDGTMWTELYGAFTNHDIITHEDLGWSTGQRWLQGGLAFANIAAPWAKPLGNGLRGLGSAVADNAIMLSGQTALLSRGLAFAGTEVAVVGGAIGSLSPWAGVGAQSLNAVFSVTGNDRRSVSDFHNSGASIHNFQQRPQHHVFPREYRALFAKRGVEIDEFVVNLERWEHEAIHGGGNWRLGRTWEGEWNTQMLNRLKERTRDLGRRLTPDEIINVGRKLLKDYGIDRPFVKYEGGW